MQEFLLALSTNHIYLVYFLIIVLACAEGPMLSVLCGILIKAGLFDFWPVYMALMVGDLIGDTIWYEIGRHLGHPFIARFGKYFGITEEKIARATEIFHKHKNRILLISKITNGFGLALVTLVTAGMVRIPFRRYIALNFIGQFVWTGILIAAGYFFGNLYAQMEKFIGRLNAVIIIAVAAVVVFYLYKYIRARILQRAHLENQ
jgi:membrane protein DedA with SNARE-associated domain